MAAILLILTLLLDEEGWVADVVELSWGEMLSSRATGASSWLSTPVGESGAIVRLPLFGFLLGSSSAAYLGCRT